MAGSIYWAPEESLYLWECMVVRNLSTAVTSEKLKARFPNSRATFTETSCQSKTYRLRYDSEFQKKLQSKDWFGSVSATPPYPHPDNTYTWSHQNRAVPGSQQYVPTLPAPAAIPQTPFTSPELATPYFTPLRQEATHSHQQIDSSPFMNPYVAIPQPQTSIAQAVKPHSPTTNRDNGLCIMMPVDHSSAATANSLQGSEHKLPIKRKAEDIGLEGSAVPTKRATRQAYYTGSTPTATIPIVAGVDAELATAQQDFNSSFGAPQFISAVSPQPPVGMSMEQYLTAVDELDKILGVGAYET